MAWKVGYKRVGLPGTDNSEGWDKGEFVCPGEPYAQVVKGCNIFVFYKEKIETPNSKKQRELFEKGD